jgi:hypothetical protein
MFFFVLGVLVSVLIYYKLIRPCSYWKDRGVKHARSWPLVGSMGAVVLKRRPFATVSLDLYNKYPEERYYLIFAKLEEFGWVNLDWVELMAAINKTCVVEYTRKFPLFTREIF